MMAGHGDPCGFAQIVVFFSGDVEDRSGALVWDGILFFRLADPTRSWRRSVVKPIMAMWVG
jgi:hypothetical protein